MKHIIIIGAGQAGAAAAINLREKGFAGAITLIGSEIHPPYERPELSKAYALANVEFSKLIILDEEAAKQRDIDLQLGKTVTRIDREQRCIVVDGKTLSYSTLILATGGCAKLLDLPEKLAEKSLTIRTREDADALSRHLKTVRNVTVIGGGWLGLEAAATCRKTGAIVDVVEASERLSARVAPSWLSNELSALHKDNGVNLHLGTLPEFLADGTIRIGDAECHPDLVIQAIGMTANDGIAQEVGLNSNDGIIVNGRCQTSDPEIYAIGDCARFSNRCDMRRESWQNANQSAEIAACSILDQPLPNEEPDWFWSNQFDANIQQLGTCQDGMTLVERADPSKNSKTCFFLQDDILQGCIAINAARDIGMSKHLISSHSKMDITALSDPANPVRSCVMA
ncbi:FAD-dependent oxidoreductase [uncultured Thalassospira sp.]|uniref:NAD(P)/FAD-dependent oxidoreductase n=1 Tax=uncultured Thalassospira sp. TaxID=404382 RepID=UPI00258336B4|nr:FAD-dependent oxidoreductase [uncultured Thalassospira sp.]